MSTSLSIFSQGGSHLDRGSQYVLHLAQVKGGSFPSEHTVDFIRNTSHQDFAMMSANVSLNWLFVYEFNQRYPDINATNPGDVFHTQTPISSHRAYATHGNITLSASMLTGSLLVVVIFFSALPFLFRPNFIEDEDQVIVEGDKKMSDDIIRFNTLYQKHDNYVNIVD